MGFLSSVSLPSKLIEAEEGFRGNLCYTASGSETQDLRLAFEVELSLTGLSP